jgi:hypothetical protein
MTQAAEGYWAAQCESPSEAAAEFCASYPNQSIVRPTSSRDTVARSFDFGSAGWRKPPT